MLLARARMSQMFSANRHTLENMFPWCSAHSAVFPSPQCFCVGSLISPTACVGAERHKNVQGRAGSWTKSRKKEKKSMPYP